MTNKPILYMVGTECDPDVEDKFNTWYDEIHIPLLLKFKGIKEVTRYCFVGTVKHPKDMHEFQALDRHMKYLAVYRFDSLEDLQVF